MIAIRKNYFQFVAAIVAGVALMAQFVAPVRAATVAPDEAKADWASQHREIFRKHIDLMANRLEIKASQQGAWQAYVRALEAAIALPEKEAEAKSDAASITRMHANRAAVRAQKLAQIADATATLQETLSPDQRHTLDQMVSRFAHRRHGFHWGEDGRHQEQH